MLKNQTSYANVPDEWRSSSDELLPRAKRLLERSNNHWPRERIIDRPEVELEAKSLSGMKR